MSGVRRNLAPQNGLTDIGIPNAKKHKNRKEKPKATCAPRFMPDCVSVATVYEATNDVHRRALARSIRLSRPIAQARAFHDKSMRIRGGCSTVRG